MGREKTSPSRVARLDFCDRLLGAGRGAQLLRSTSAAIRRIRIFCEQPLGRFAGNPIPANRSRRRSHKCEASVTNAGCREVAKFWNPEKRSRFPPIYCQRLVPLYMVIDSWEQHVHAERSPKLPTPRKIKAVVSFYTLLAAGRNMRMWNVGQNYSPHE